MDTNIVVLVGRLTRNVEVRYVGEKNTAVANIGLAVNGRRNGDEEEVTFVDVTVWGRVAEVLGDYAQKGKQLAVTGHLRLETWEKDGQKRSKLGVVAENVQLLGGNNAAAAGNAEVGEGTPPTGGEAPKRGPGRPKKSAEKPANTNVDNEEIPF